MNCSSTFMDSMVMYVSAIIQLLLLQLISGIDASLNLPSNLALIGNVIGASLCHSDEIHLRLVTSIQITGEGDRAPGHQHWPLGVQHLHPH
ncbi:hypothetical protein V8B97DRAFT_1721906 [Scleroderma yunnanense]